MGIDGARHQSRNNDRGSRSATYTCSMQTLASGLHRAYAIMAFKLMQAQALLRCRKKDSYGIKRF
jgi:hypothetical protein